MALRLYRPTDQSTEPKVLIDTGKGFLFSATASQMAGLDAVQWMRVYPDDDDRLIVFEPVAGLDKPPYSLKLSAFSSRHLTRRLTAKGVINQTPWINTVATLPNTADRKFSLKPYHGPLPPVPGANSGPPRTAWYIRLMPAFEESLAPSEIKALSSDLKGIYRYLGGDDGQEIVYIGKGDIKGRFQQESVRKNWGVHRIEYSVIGDDQQAYEWERWWIERHKKEHNGRRPRYNKVDGLRSNLHGTKL